MLDGAPGSTVAGVQEDEMKRFAACILLLTFCTGVSKAAAPNGDKPPSSAATTSATKSVDSNKPRVPENKNDNRRNGTASTPGACRAAIAPPCDALSPYLFQ